MAAPKGNKFWLARSKHGRDKIFTSPDILWDACCEYFEWNHKNPLQAAELVKFQGRASVKRVPKMRAMTISGLCLFLDIAVQTWHNMKNDNDFLEIITRVEEIIYNQKLTGAAADMLNANIISRELGLVDKQENNLKGQVVSKTVNLEIDENTSPEDAAKIYQEFIRLGKEEE